MTYSQNSILRNLYLDLLKSVIINDIYKDPPIIRKKYVPKSLPKEIKEFFPGYRIGNRYNTQERDEGFDWPSVAHSMIGRKRMNNLQYCVETVINESIPGDLIETGVWRGGACIFIQGILKAYGETHRKVYLADSFEGLPPPNHDKYPQDRNSQFHKKTPLKVSLEEVKDNFQLYGLLQPNVVFLKGWFKDTLPNAPIREISVLRLDGDMYESTMDALVNLHCKVSPGGFVIIDDYGLLPECREAVQDFLRMKKLEDILQIQEIDTSGRFWRVPK